MLLLTYTNIVWIMHSLSLCCFQKDIISYCRGHIWLSRLSARKRKGFKCVNPHFPSIILFVCSLRETVYFSFLIAVHCWPGAWFTTGLVGRVLSGAEWLSRNLGNRWIAGIAAGSKPARKAVAANRSLAASGDKVFRDSSSRLGLQLGTSTSLLTSGLLIFWISRSIKFLKCSFSFWLIRQD